jgi:hypothetical protein
MGSASCGGISRCQSRDAAEVFQIIGWRLDQGVAANLLRTVSVLCRKYHSTLQTAVCGRLAVAPCDTKLPLKPGSQIADLEGNTQN